MISTGYMAVSSRPRPQAPSPLPSGGLVGTVLDPIPGSGLDPIRGSMGGAKGSALGSMGLYMYRLDTFNTPNGDESDLKYIFKALRTRPEGFVAS